MNRIENVFGQSIIDREQLRGTGEIICQCCIGTGINPNYRVVNLIQNAINELGTSISGHNRHIFHSANTNAPYCLSCYGMKKIDWVQYATDSYKQELIDMKIDVKKWFLRDVEPFLEYIHRGEVWHETNSYKYPHFDLEKNCWIEGNPPKDDFSSLKAAFKWLHRFKAEGYFDYDNFADVAPNYQELYWIEPDLYFRGIKLDLLFSKKISINRLFEIKNELHLFFRHIQDLDRIIIEEDVNRKSADGFRFTWENIFRKFGLPLIYLCYFNSDGVEFRR